MFFFLQRKVVSDVRRLQKHRGKVNTFKSSFRAAKKAIARSARAIFGKKGAAVLTSAVAIAASLTFTTAPAHAAAPLTAFTCSPTPYFTDNAGNWLKYDVPTNKFVWASSNAAKHTLPYALNGIGYNTDDNLKALCQRCHLTYDAKHHAENSATTRHHRKLAAGQIEMFPRSAR